MTVLMLSSPEPRWTGLAADAKPTPDTPGASFFETDTGAAFFWDGAAWTQISGGVPLVGTFTISENDTRSNILAAAVYAQYRSIAIVAEDVALTGTVTVECLQTAAKTESLDASWSAVQSPPGTDVTIAAQKCIVLLASNFLKLSLNSSTAELTADKIFSVYGTWS